LGQDEVQGASRGPERSGKVSAATGLLQGFVLFLEGADFAQGFGFRHLGCREGQDNQHVDLVFQFCGSDLTLAGDVALKNGRVRN
jgi:hypothetical protein